MSSSPVASFVGEGWPEDEGWVRVGDWSPDPVDAVYDVDGGPGVDDVPWTDEELLAARGPVSEWDLPVLVSIDPLTLSVAGRLDFLHRVEALEALVAAQKVRGLVAAAGTDGSDSTRDRHVTMEVAQVRRVGEGAAQTAIATARALHVEFPGFLAALEAGEVSEWHCRVLVSETAHVTEPATIAALQDRLLPKAKRRTPAEFRREVRKAVADLDAEREAERHALARADRYVTFKPLPDGMGYVGIVTDWASISAIQAVNTADGRALQLARGGAKAARAGDDDAFADASRADAFVTRFLGTGQRDGSTSVDLKDIPVSLTLVMDLPTLRSEAGRHALLNGEPIPADVGRDYAKAAVLWRRAVTDPVSGHLLDYGREQYLPDKLRDYIVARDHCRAPGCTTRATSRLQMDHAVPFPDGDTSTANCGGLCGKHHQLKTDRLAHLLDTDADGSATWLTAWGQRLTIPPRPFLHDPADHLPMTEADEGPPLPDPSPAVSPADDPPKATPPPASSPTSVSELMYPPTTRRPGTSGGFDARDCDIPRDPPF